MRVLVTGAGGMLGRDVVAAAVAGDHDVIALDRAALDILDRTAIWQVVHEELPHAVINCAAWTDVDGAEDEESAARAVNGDAARELAEAAGEVGAVVVYPSTDYVFDGRRARPYLESDPVGPRSAYGRSKLAGEIGPAIANPRPFSVRTSWLFGVGGRNSVDTMLRLGAERPELKVVGDQIGSPTYTGHLAVALVQLAGTELYGIHHVAGAGHCSWHRLACEAFELSGMCVRVAECTTAEFPRPAPRPAYSVLRTERRSTPVLPPWQEGLNDYLSERRAGVREEVAA
jgi:dTDP-4-dehydrorhamnose reductase